MPRRSCPMRRPLTPANYGEHFVPRTLANYHTRGLAQFHCRACLGACCQLHFLAAVPSTVPPQLLGSCCPSPVPPGLLGATAVPLASPHFFCQPLGPHKLSWLQGPLSEAPSFWVSPLPRLLRGRLSLPLVLTPVFLLQEAGRATRAEQPHAQLTVAYLILIFKAFLVAVIIFFIFEFTYLLWFLP